MGCSECRRGLIATCKEHHSQVVVVLSSTVLVDFAAGFSRPVGRMYRHSTSYMQQNYRQIFRVEQLRERHVLPYSLH